VEGFIAALNRIENRLIDGSLLFETHNDRMLIGIAVLSSALFLCVFAGMAVQVVRLDLLLILLVAASYEFEWLVPIPFLMRRLVCGLTDASSVPATVASLAGLSFCRHSRPRFSSSSAAGQFFRLRSPRAAANCHECSHLRASLTDRVLIPPRDWRTSSVLCGRTAWQSSRR
jgi:hypothetical protein